MMNNIEHMVQAIAYSIWYILTIFITGSAIVKLGVRVYPKIYNFFNHFQLLIPIIGILGYSLSVWITHKICAPISIFVSSTPVVIFIFKKVFFDRNLKCDSSILKSIAITAGFSTFCILMLFAFSAGANPGDNLLWTIYNLTHITPGDSPQGMFQAQYLEHGKHLIGLTNFSLFDRPFLGGLITQCAFYGVGKTPSIFFNHYNINELVLYIGLWIGLNSLFIIGLLAVLTEIGFIRNKILILVIVMSSPYVIFGTIGLWPKFLALYFLICGALLVKNKYYAYGICLSGISFMLHGSFLWAHLSMGGIILIYILFYQKHNRKRLKVMTFAKCSILYLAFPVTWFGAEKLTDFKTPLQQYYLYDVPVSYGLHNSHEKIADQFYNSTSPSNLTVLPFANLAKSILPLEILNKLLQFSYKGETIHSSEYGELLFLLQFNRPLFCFGCIAGVIIILGFISPKYSRPWFDLSVVAFFILPLIPGFVIYRRDDIFLSCIMMYALIPIILYLGAGLEKIKNRHLYLVCATLLLEYIAIYLSRAPRLKYTDYYVNYYAFLVVITLSIIAVLLALQLIKTDTPYKSTQLPSRPRTNFEIKSHFVIFSCCLLLIAGFIGPKLFIYADKGFASGQSSIDLMHWDDVTAKKGDQPLIHDNLELDSEQKGIWINSGQSLRFNCIDITRNSVFAADFKVHDQWNKDQPIPLIKIKVNIYYGDNPKPQGIYEKSIGGDRKNYSDWLNIEFPLQFNNTDTNEVNIELEPQSDVKGVWTLWRSPRIYRKIN